MTENSKGKQTKPKQTPENMVGAQRRCEGETKYLLSYAEAGQESRLKDYRFDSRL